jgi:protein gp37
MEAEWVFNIRRQCVASGVPMFYKQSGGLRGGDCLLDGLEIKEWPLAA